MHNISNILTPARDLNTRYFMDLSAGMQACISDIMYRINGEIIKASIRKEAFIRIFTQDFYKDMKRHKIAKMQFDTIESFILNTLRIYGYRLRQNVMCEYYISWA